MRRFYSKNMWLLSALAGGLALIITFVVGFCVAAVNVQKARKSAENLAMDYCARVVDYLNMYDYGRTLATILETGGTGNITAQGILRDNPDIQYFAVIENTGVDYEVVRVHSSVENNSLAVGTTVSELPFIYATAQESAIPVSEGPILDNYINKNVFVFVRSFTVPSTSESSGMIATVVDANKVISSFALDTLYEEGYDVSLWSILADGSRAVAYTRGEVNLSDSIEQKFFARPNTWSLQLSKRDGWVSAYEWYMPVIVGLLLFGAVFAAVRFGLFAKQKIDEVRNVQMFDPITDMYNKEGFIDKLASWSIAEKPFAVFYVYTRDFPEYQQIAAKSDIIEYFNKIIKALANLKKNYIYGRPRDNSFAIAIEGEFGLPELEDMRRSLALDILQPLYTRHGEKFLNSDIAYAVYPSDGATADKVFDAAVAKIRDSIVADMPLDHLLETVNKLNKYDADIVWKHYSDEKLDKIESGIRTYYENNRRMLYLDGITKIGNRNAYIREVDGIINSEREKEFILFVMNIDEFRRVNEIYSSVYGDKILQLTAARLKTVFKELCYRVDGDIFTGVLLDTNEYQSTLLKINETLSRPFTIDSAVLNVMYSIGVAIYPNHGTSAAALMESANIAAESAKNKLDVNYFVYNDELSERIKRENEIVRKLRSSIGDKTLQVYYQPVRNEKTNRFDRAEALLRLFDDDGAAYPSEEVIRFAEKHGLMSDIGNYVVEDVCDTIKRMKAERCSIGKINVNYSAQQLLRPTHHTSVLSILSVNGVSPDKIAIEITESMFINSLNSASAALAELKKYGVDIILDDFGTGYSSFSYLTELPLTGIKLDYTLVNGIGASEKRYNMVKAVMSIAELNGFSVCAEGVETQKTLDIVRGLNITQVQGYFYSPPLNKDDFIAFIKEYNRQAGKPFERKSFKSVVPTLKKSEVISEEKIAGVSPTAKPSSADELREKLAAAKASVEKQKAAKLTDSLKKNGASEVAATKQTAPVKLTDSLKKSDGKAATMQAAVIPAAAAKTATPASKVETAKTAAKTASASKAEPVKTATPAKTATAASKAETAKTAVKTASASKVEPVKTSLSDYKKTIEKKRAEFEAANKWKAALEKHEAQTKTAMTASKAEDKNKKSDTKAAKATEKTKADAKAKASIKAGKASSAKDKTKDKKNKK